jgi:exodeoxyribonuclease V alpha subunit
MIKINASIDKVLFENESNGFCVIKVTPTDIVSEQLLIDKTGKKSIIVTGVFYSPTEGAFLRCEGALRPNPKYNGDLNLVANAISLSRLNNQNFTSDFLRSGIIRNLKSLSAEKIIKKFGKDSLSVMSSNPLAINKEADIAKDELLASITDLQKLNRINAPDTFNFLRSVHLNVEQSLGVMTTFGSKSKQIIIENPYEIMSIQSIGFMTVDNMALTMGMSEHHPCRLSHAISHSMNYFKSVGNIGVNMSSVVTMAQKLLKIDRAYIEDFIENRIDRKTLFVMGDDKHRFVVDSDLYEKEVDCANQIKRLITSPFQSRHRPIRLDESFLKTNQLLAIKKAIYAKVSIVTGGPGYGKTTVAKSITKTLRESSNDSGKIILAAPTGKAASRLSESTGEPAVTIHSLLGFDEEQGFGDETKTLDVDTLLIDEVSMLDVVTFHKTLKSLPSHARLILIGDDDQLSSVDVGNVLHDLINSGVVQVTKLNEVVRRDKDSAINMASDAVNKGIMPDLNGDKEFRFIEAETDTEVLEKCMGLIAHDLPRVHNIPHSNILVLSPKWAGVDGVDNFNTRIREVANPLGNGNFSVSKYGKTFQVNDVVMQLKNNKDLDISNGDTGVIKFISLSRDDQHAIVEFNGENKRMTISELFSMKLAYALTIHKSQGSEADAVIIPLSKNHENMLSRELLYTGITRGKKIVYVVGSKDVLSKAINNLAKNNRKTFLKEHLKMVLPQLPKTLNYTKKPEVKKRESLEPSM